MNSSSSSSIVVDLKMYNFVNAKHDVLRRDNDHTNTFNPQVE